MAQNEFDIEEIIFAEGYPDDLAELMLLESNIKIRKFNLTDGEVESIHIGTHDLAVHVAFHY